jgi:hypothetical protein
MSGPWIALRKKRCVLFQRKVSQDAMISFESNRYSVPWIHAGKSVELKVVQGRLVISYGGKEIAAHPLLSGKNGQALCPGHYAGLMSSKARGPEAKRPPHDPSWREEATDVSVRSLSLYDQIAKALSVLGGVAW